MRSAWRGALALALAACGGGGGGSQAPGALAAPEGLAVRSVTEMGEGIAYLTWRAVPAATSYRLELRSPPGGAPTTLDASGLAADLGGLVPGRPYAISVAALAGGAEGARSAAVPFTPPVPPAPPTALAVGERYDAAAVLDAVLLTWAPSADRVDGYRIYRSTDGGSTWAERGTAADAVHVDPLGADEVCQRLRYRVASYRGDASSARSADEAVRGTVLASSSTTDPFDTVTSESPYLVEGAVVLETQALRVNSRTTLCIGPGATLSLPDGASVGLWGMVRVVGEAARPARIQGRPPAAGAATGLMLFTSPWFDDDTSAHYDPATRRGSKLEYAEIGPLLGLNFSSRTLVRESRFLAVPPGWPATIGTACPRIEDSTFDGFWLTVTTSCASQPNAAVLRSRFTATYGARLEVTGFTGTGSPSDTFAPGQLAGNSFASASVNVHDFSAPGTLHLGGNYWSGTPEAQISPPSGGTIAVDFSPVLPGEPQCGATW